LLFTAINFPGAGARMILTCPACQTSYTVKDGAIPPQGRTVRCAACKHSWQQAGEEPVFASAPVEPEVVATDEQFLAAPPLPEPAAVSAEPPAMVGDAALIPPNAETGDPEPTPVAEPEGVVEAQPLAEGPPEPAAVAEDSGWNDAPYGDEEAAPRRKGPLLILALVLFVAALAAAAYFLAPTQWMARAGLAEASADSPLKLMVTSQDRQPLASGNNLYSLSGRVINPTDQTEPVPPLQAELANGAGKIVYSWIIPLPTARLAPGASSSFNAAELGVPASAKYLTLRWAS
jgi:predicted Zn finger-like uncharacterized protein